MTTFYLDFENGNDANDGTSFANRWKTIKTGATAARTAPGDTIRIMGSPAPTSLGINGTWTNKSATVTLASALSKTASDCESAWTASANVTHAASTLFYRQGSNARQFTFAAGFTTGKVAYVALGSSQDFSGYQQLGFWFRSSSAIATGVLKVCLCSDTIGDTIVDEFLIPVYTTGSRWIPVVVNKGSNLGAAIQSVSIHAVSDPGTITFQIDNIEAYKDSTGADSLTLLSLIGKNTDDGYWWPIRSIVGTTIILETATVDYTPATTQAGYYGTSETVTTYKRECIRPTTIDATAVQESGTSGNVITYRGGYDRTNMTTRNLETYLDGRAWGSSSQMCIGVAAIEHISFFNLSAVGYGYGCGTTVASSDYLAFETCQALMSVTANWRIPNRSTIGSCLSLGGGNNTVIAPNGTTFDTVYDVVFILDVVSCTPTNLGGFVTELELHECSGSLKFRNIRGYVNFGGQNCNFYEMYIHDVAGIGGAVHLGSIHNFIIQEFNAIGTVASGTAVISAGLGSGHPTMNPFITEFYILSGTIEVPTSRSAYNFFNSETTGVSGWAVFGDIDYTGTGSADPVVIMGATNKFILYLPDYSSVSGEHRIYLDNDAYWSSETTERHTAAGISWKLQLQEMVVSFAHVMPLGKFWVVEEQDIIVSMWVKRTHADIVFSLGNSRNTVDYYESDVASGTVDVWEKVTFTLANSIASAPAGIIEISIAVTPTSSGALSGFVYIDDFTIEQLGTGPDFRTLDHVHVNARFPFLGPSVQAFAPSIAPGCRNIQIGSGKINV